MVGPNEILLHENGQWLHFNQPHQIFNVSALAEVVPTLREIERVVTEKGWHAAGFLSYEAAPAFDPAFHVRPATDFPLLWFGLYPPPIPIQLPAAPPQPAPADWQPTVSRETYQTAIAAIKAAIARGETYQVNYTLRLRAQFKADPWELFLQLVRAQGAGYATYVNTGRWVIACASPELFFRLEGETLTTRPMKGTVKRGRTSTEDAAQAAWLQNSLKNRAENVMIVDMLRNDLGRIAEIGSVQVPELFTAERYPTLWQMTSTVTAKTQASLTEILTNLFPCASITGAPKVRTMQIIAELESTPRQIYTGSIGHLAPGRQAQFNVAIRTVLLDQASGQAEYGLGGGIVWDSTSADEYAEALLKARVLTHPPPEFSLLETLRWTPTEGWFLREKHLARLLDSAAYFGFPAHRESLVAWLEAFARDFETSQRVRLLLARDGQLTGESAPLSLEPLSKPVTAALAANPIESSEIFLFHKTTRRAFYATAQAARPEAEDVLLYNERGELTEFTLGNLVVEMAGKLFTPPLECGLLAGTFRAHLLETGQVQERRIPLRELSNCTHLLRVNSVRGWQTIHLALD
jgi:para-aminobenzoate synthetase/4-amino-4-deoxychorismate lyase